MKKREEREEVKGDNVRCEGRRKQNKKEKGFENGRATKSKKNMTWKVEGLGRAGGGRRMRENN